MQFSFTESLQVKSNVIAIYEHKIMSQALIPHRVYVLHFTEVRGIEK